MIAIKQNKLVYYKLLKAQRTTYSRAKIIRNFKYSLTLGLIVTAPFVFIYSPASISTIGIIGAAWTLISFLVGYMESWLIRRAATLQEIIDTELYEMSWNEIVYGQKVIPHEYVNGITYKYSEIELETEFKDWYEGIGNIQKPFSILLCQRQNIVWDYKLRDVYAYIVLSILAVNFLVGLSIFAITGETVLNYLLGLLLPSLSANILGIEEVVGHLRISKRKKELENKMVELINLATNNFDSLTENVLRDIQNVIFNERLKSPLIPDFIHNRLKLKYSNSSRASINDIMMLNNNYCQPR
ncbi:MAG: S-4TM family putative pore-forming effector [Pseudomonadota bacterium]